MRHKVRQKSKAHDAESGAGGARSRGRRRGKGTAARVVEARRMGKYEAAFLLAEEGEVTLMKCARRHVSILSCFMARCRTSGELEIVIALR